VTIKCKVCVVLESAANQPSASFITGFVRSKRDAEFIDAI